MKKLSSYHQIDPRKQSSLNVIAVTEEHFCCPGPNDCYPSQSTIQLLSHFKKHTQPLPTNVTNMTQQLLLHRKQLPTTPTNLTPNPQQIITTDTDKQHTTTDNINNRQQETTTTDKQHTKNSNRQQQQTNKWRSKFVARWKPSFY